MKPYNYFLTIVIMMSILLNACSPVPSPSKPNLESYPVEDSTINAEGDEQEAGSQLAGNLAYITNPQATAEELHRISLASNQFALDLYQHLLDKEGNLIYSPFSIYQALLMTYTGAEGETAEQMKDVLGVQDDNQIHNLMNALNVTLMAEPGYTTKDMQPLIFNMTNALWAQKNFHFEQDFLDKLSANYAAGLNLVDYSQPEEARKLINLFVASQTNDKIKELIPQGMLNEMTRLVLTNTVYFKAAWQNRFDEAQTQKDDFTTLDGSVNQVDMMNQSLTTGAFIGDGFVAANLPYEGNTFAMAAILPEDFVAYQKSLNAEALDKILQNLGENRALVQLSMPKFSTMSSIDLASKLMNMGMGNAFNSEIADFSGMTGGKDLYISDVVHQAFIDVNEEGTEAAAATMVGMVATGMPAETITLRLDRPFIYVIYNVETNAIVFMGHVVNP